MTNNRGQSILEIILALALFVLVVSGLAVFLLSSFQFNTRSQDFIKAGFLAQEALEAVKSIRDRSWNNLSYEQSAVATSSIWYFVGEGTSENIGKFERVISFEDVYRDNNYEIVEASNPNAVLDASSTLIRVRVSWSITENKKDSVEYISYLTNWR